MNCEKCGVKPGQFHPIECPEHIPHNLGPLGPKLPVILLDCDVGGLIAETMEPGLRHYAQSYFDDAIAMFREEMEDELGLPDDELNDIIETYKKSLLKKYRAT